MKYIKTYENFLDKILDKINDTGMSSLTEVELNYLNAQAHNDTDRIANIEKQVSKVIYKSDDGMFEFEYSHKEDLGKEKIYYGIIHVPSITDYNGKYIDGTIQGYIEVRDGLAEGNFEKEIYGATYDVYEFCEGLEYELDDFFHDTVDEIEEDLN